MMLFFISFLHDSLGIKVPGVFSYYSTRMMLAAITALVLCIFLGPRFIRKLYELKIGQNIRVEEACPMLEQLHGKKKDTPTMGGILILFSMFVSMFLWMDWHSVFTLFLLLTTVVLGLLGGRDDYLKLKYKNTKGLSIKKRLLIQTLFAALIVSYFYSPALQEALHHGEWFVPPIIKEQIVMTKSAIQDASEPFLTSKQLSLTQYISRLYMPFLKDPILTFTGIGSVVGFIFLLFVIVGSTNAVNLTDGLDGLAAGCLIMVATCLAIFAFFSNHIDFARYLNILYVEESGEIAIYLSALAGACLGFLWYNGYPAQVFMGDTGSLALGGVIGVSAVLLKRELLLAIIGGIFVAEVLSDIIQIASFRLRNKKRVFLCAPLHHHFEFKGWPETKVVIRFWIIGLLLALIGIVSLKFQ